jgi:phospholipase D1/2
MLQAAAQRGVKVNIIVYKEVTQALTRKYLTPLIPSYLHSLLPKRTDAITSVLSRLGLAATFASLEYVEAENPLIGPVVTVCSSHTKHVLEKLHPNIAVFRHPDHLPDAQTLHSSFMSSLQNLSLNAKAVSQLPYDTLKAVYGMNDDVILYWAHHEKLCLVDGKTAFMGGLDLCYGRWDTNQHSIADCHPSDLDNIVFPGQDFNNARIMDFQDVPHWENNKLSRKDSSRMGWSDVSVSLHGAVVEDLQLHFVERWNFIYNEKYHVRKDVRYSKLLFQQREVGAHPNPNRPAIPQSDAPYQVYPPPSYPPANTQPMDQTAYYSPPPVSNQGQYYPPPPTSSRGFHEDDGRRDEAQRHGGRSTPERHHHLRRRLDEAGLGGAADAIRERLESRVQRLEDRHAEHHVGHHGASQGGMLCQIVRSVSKWSHGIGTEHSIADAYINVIKNSQHFVYIENQFFITATSDAQKPVRNKIGAAIVERILRAARAEEKYKIIVIMPAVPAFAGDLKDDASLGTRAIMEFQYNSINRGGHSILEVIANAGYDPTEYIRFYNLRNYDRINVSAAMLDAEQRSGVNYEDARRDHDAAVQVPASSGFPHSAPPQNYQHYQEAAGRLPSKQGLGSGRWDSVSECYMLGGPDIRQVPWENGAISEMDAFVSEELYVHSKVSFPF